MDSIEREVNADRTVVALQKGATYQAAHGMSYFGGISGETAGARGICMQYLEMPVGAAAKPHCHPNHESAIYLIEGEIETLYGEQLEHSVVSRAGDFLYIPPGIPHLPRNVGSVVAKAIVARTDAAAVEDVQLMEHLLAHAQSVDPIRFPSI